MRRKRNTEIVVLILAASTKYKKKHFEMTCSRINDIVNDFFVSKLFLLYFSEENDFGFW